MKKSFFPFLISILLTSACISQPFTRQDTLRGSINAERDWWNVISYELNVTPDYATKTIKGWTRIQFTLLKPGINRIMQIDLQEPLVIDSIHEYPDAKYKRDGNVYLIDFGGQHFTEKDTGDFKLYTITISYHGKPIEAKQPPWDGGWIWQQDQFGRPWMSVACQVLGASAWYPCKDHLSDEPELGAAITINIPDTLAAVANGRIKDFNPKIKPSWTWQVKNPINNYGIIPYIGKYTSWKEEFMGEKGKLDCEYWVLDYNYEVAKEQFKQAALTLKAFEHWFGPYPFYEDGYKLVEAPHLGMEHQSAVAYGNGYKNGYRGRDLSETGWGLKWDFIIVHESGHEWFGNNITAGDVADLWIHEAFTNYSETLFTDFHYGKEAGNAYCIGTRKLISNEKPIIGVYGVNKTGSGDMYYKGGNLIHTIRQLINDDEKFRMILRGLNSYFYHQTVTTKQIEDYISEKSGIDLSKVFDQYLRTIMVPVLEYKTSNSSLSFRWNNVVAGFDMRVRLTDGTWLDPTVQWKETPLRETLKKNIEIDKNFYVLLKKINND